MKRSSLAPSPAELSTWAVCLRLALGIAATSTAFISPAYAGLTLNQNATTADITTSLDGPGLSISNLVVSKGVLGQYARFLVAQRSAA